MESTSKQIHLAPIDQISIFLNIPNAILIESNQQTIQTHPSRLPRMLLKFLQLDRLPERQFLFLAYLRLWTATIIDG